jgi:hypothetical protein
VTQREAREADLTLGTTEPGTLPEQEAVSSTGVLPMPLENIPPAASLATYLFVEPSSGPMLDTVPFQMNYCKLFNHLH